MTCRLRELTGLTFAWLATLACGTYPASARDRLSSLLRIVPADAHAAVVIPNLKRASDDLTRMLEGMDRSGILLGSRPIDQLKSNTGFNTEIDDQGSAAIIITAGAASPSRMVSILPAQDLHGFFEGNFTGRADPADDTAFKRADGSVMYARTFDSHVAMSADAATLRAFEPAEGIGISLAKRLESRSIAGLDDADALIVIRPPMLAAAKRSLLGLARNDNAMVPGVAMLANALIDDLDAIIVAVQFDPLALIVHSTLLFSEASAFGMHAPDTVIPDAGLARLPLQPAALAITVDCAALGGEAIWRDLATAMHDKPAEVPPWLRAARSIQFMSAPSEAGPQAGMLNAAVLALACESPATMRDEIKNDMMAVGSGPNAAFATRWTDAQQLADGSTADAYAFRPTDPTADIAAIEALLFGTGGARGYLRTLSDCVVMTFSARQTLLEEAARAAETAHDKFDSGWSDSPAVKVMRDWMPVQRDVEAYVGAAQLTAMIQPYQAMLPLHGLGLPQFDPHAPPIGMAADVSAHRMDAAIIVPAAVLAPAFDEAIRFMRTIRHDAAPAAKE